jgi:hypothetical protein
MRSPIPLTITKKYLFAYFDVALGHKAHIVVSSEVIVAFSKP